MYAHALSGGSLAGPTFADTEDLAWKVAKVITPQGGPVNLRDSQGGASVIASVPSGSFVRVYNRTAKSGGITFALVEVPPKAGQFWGAYVKSDMPDSTVWDQDTSVSQRVGWLGAKYLKYQSASVAAAYGGEGSYGPASTGISEGQWSTVFQPSPAAKKLLKSATKLKPAVFRKPPSTTGGNIPWWLLVGAGAMVAGVGAPIAAGAAAATYFAAKTT